MPILAIAVAWNITGKSNRATGRRALGHLFRPGDRVAYGGMLSEGRAEIAPRPGGSAD
jgi:hypothetical protein